MWAIQMPTAVMNVLCISFTQISQDNPSTLWYYNLVKYKNALFSVEDEDNGTFSCSLQSDTTYGLYSHDIRLQATGND